MLARAVLPVPPTWLGYRHGGCEMYIDSKGRVRMVKGWRRVVDRLRGFVHGLGRLNIDHFSDHSIEHYIAHIHAAVQKEQRAMTQWAPRRRQIAAM